MATNVISASITSASVVASVNAFDGLYILPGVAVVSTDANTIVGLSGAAITVAGSVWSGNGAGILISGISGRVMIHSGAQVTGTGNAVAINGDGGRIANYGRISTFNTSVEISGLDCTVVNHGQVFGALGVRMIGNGSVLVNHGDITSVSNTAVEIFGSTGVADVVRVTNAGTIIASTGNAIVGDVDATDIITNHGLISGHVAQVAGNDTFLQTATGVLIGSVFAGSGSDAVRNFGVIHGSIIAESQDDQVVNGGLIDGDVVLGQGEDSYFATPGGQVLGLILGNDGNDEIRGGDGAETVQGGSGDDLIVAGGGDDTINGDDGADALRGGDGDDSLSGDDGADVVAGGDGDDALTGGAGADRLVGDAGADTLVGGSDRDLLFGGADADVFRYAAAIHSGLGALSDVILDFETGLDLIDLEGVMAGDLVFGSIVAGTAGVRVQETAAGDSIVSVDANADGVAEMRIVLKAVTGITEQDLIL